MNKFSDRAIERQIDKVDKMQEVCNLDFPMLPVDLETNKDIVEVINHRSKLSFISGFWLGWALRRGCK